MGTLRPPAGDRRTRGPLNPTPRNHILSPQEMNMSTPTDLTIIPIETPSLGDRSFGSWALDAATLMYTGIGLLRRR